jgi:small multidrug resistance family-3 protein
MMLQLSTWALFALAAVLEIAGCFGVWLWLRAGRSPAWAIAGVVSLIAFAWVLTRVPSNAAGRTFAAYGGVYIIASLAWLYGIEQIRPTRTDLIGGSLSLLGTAIILLGARTSD